MVSTLRQETNHDRLMGTTACIDFAKRHVGVPRAKSRTAVMSEIAGAKCAMARLSVCRLICRFPQHLLVSRVTSPGDRGVRRNAVGCACAKRQVSCIPTRADESMWLLTLPRATSASRSRLAIQGEHIVVLIIGDWGIQVTRSASFASAGR